MSDERSINEVEHFIFACGNASRRYYDMGDDGARRMAEAYGQSRWKSPRDSVLAAGGR